MPARPTPTPTQPNAYYHKFDSDRPSSVERVDAHFVNQVGVLTPTISCKMSNVILVLVQFFHFLFLNYTQDSYQIVFSFGCVGRYQIESERGMKKRDMYISCVGGGCGKNQFQMGS